ncbi:contact-dependent growth inhibition system immunity protein [Prevotella sp.]|uniref:contact-dependent growth inhibition system immunity protein n=1 Tax=Prevotella sp. TaxID=59823 RepID=UPI002F9284B9
MENNHKTLSQLLNEPWQGEVPTKADSYVLRSMYRLYGTQIGKFTVEDLRFIIGQGMLPEVFIPMAMEVLAKNILADGDFYEGDLLSSVLNIKESYWENHAKELSRFIDILLRNQSVMDAFDGPRELVRAYDAFLTKWGDSAKA